MEELWIKVKELLEQRVKPNAFSLWIKPILFISAETGKLTLSAPNKFSRNRINDNYLGDIKNAWKQISGEEIEITFDIREQKKTKDSQVPRVCTPKKPFDYDFSNPRPLRDSFTFDNFVTGPQNELAFHAAQAIAASENGNVPNGIILLLSPNGLGKTHLSQSAVDLRNQKYPELKVFYLTVQDFTDMMTKAMRRSGNFNQDTKAMESFKQGFIDADLFVLDEVDHLPGKKRTQKELAFIIDHLMDRGKKIIYCSNTGPAKIKDVNRQLLSRIKMAPVIEIEPPDQETRTKILIEKSKLWNCPITTDVASYLAESVRGDVRKIEGILSQLLIASQALKHPISLSFAQRVLQKFILRQEGVTPDFITDQVCSILNISMDTIRSRSRYKTEVWARYVLAHLLLKHCNLDHKTVGKIINRSRSSVPRIPGKIEEFVAIRKYKLQLEHIESQLQKRLAV